jgi:hypothetical protein
MSLAEKTIIIPDMQKVDVPAVVGSNYKRSGYSVEVSPTPTRYSDGSFVGNKNQEQALKILAEKGFVLPPMALLTYLAETQGRESPFFVDAFGKHRSDVGKYRWEPTGTRLLTPAGWENGKQDKIKGRVYYPRDVFEYHIVDGKLHLVQIAEGEKIPQRGIVPEGAIDKVTGMAAETIDDVNTPHIMHHYIDPALKETVVFFGSFQYLGERDRCLGASANYERWNAYSDNGFRPVRGSFGVLEKLAKSYEDGLREGRELGLEQGRSEGIGIGRREVLDEIYLDSTRLCVKQFNSKYRLHD